jgi:predicted RNA-binding protein associated with RNAse of E/G family
VTAAPRVAIHYHRPPDRLRIYDQRVVLERADVIITLSEPLDLSEPMIVEDRVMLEEGSLALWFTFPGLWHDIGRFHRADGRETGLYANVLTPVRIEGRVWHTTDLYLDVWRPTGGRARILDEDELHEAIIAGHVDEETAARAQQEAKTLHARAGDGSWPPPVVEEWTLARALDALSRVEQRA